jgi:phosphatidylglycerophosphate synthase
MSSVSTKKKQVLLYWPNVVDYVRLLLAVGLFSWWDHRMRPLLFASLYIVGFVLDGVDGMLARRLNQVSCNSLGALLARVNTWGVLGLWS